jgi:hypothetical protein
LKWGDVVKAQANIQKSKEDYERQVKKNKQHLYKYCHSLEALIEKERSLRKC